MTDTEMYLMGLLQGDATLMGMVANRVYLDKPHSNAKTPFVLATFYAGQDTTTVNAVRILSQLDYTVRVVTKASDSNAKTIAQRIDTLLHQAAANETLGILGCVRRTPVNISEVNSGVVYKHIGYIYRVFKQ